ncbi:MAG: three-Cys-motif partner protein TcmP [Dehalococcoidales bacterium]|nr:three-Cys-motif partner protein TcmP [Dehalococcoidales bacterium]
MALEFHQDAICLSGLTGSKLKCQILGEYYPFWWNITSGGPSNNHGWATAIVELNAATGEAYIEDTKETILGSAGHALELKCNRTNTTNLKVILVEENSDCYQHLKNVISRRWPNINLLKSENPLYLKRSDVVLLNNDLDKAVNSISQLKLGNSLFFFDPLRSVPYDTIEIVAKERLKTYHQTGTEFIIFIFTSDWFLGRDEFCGLPITTAQDEWTDSEKLTVFEADALFGNTKWRKAILRNRPIHEREMEFVELYRQALHKWFRYVLPMPFNPKGNQVYHLMLCSNYEAGVRATRGFFCDMTRNPDYKPNNSKAHRYFRARHPELYVYLKSNQRPKEWRFLWSTINNHEEGICDCFCRDIQEIEKDVNKRNHMLNWLVNQDYFIVYSKSNSWKVDIIQYKVNWETVKRYLDISPPKELEPYSLRPTSLWEINL